MARRTLLVLTAAAAQALAQTESTGLAPEPSISSGVGSKSSGSTGTSPAGTIQDGNTQAAFTFLFALAAAVVVIAVYQLVLMVTRYIRKLICLRDEKQRFFSTPCRWFGAFKEHLFYAPLVRTRHYRELRFLHRCGVGALPTRFQSILLLCIVSMNIGLAVDGIEWNEPTSVNTLKHFRNRTGTMAVANMIPLVIMAGRNNPLIPLLNVSFDSFNMMHRWFGRICAALAIVHMGSFLAADVNLEGWAKIGESFKSDAMAITGLIALVAFFAINIQAMAPLRHAFYEFFLHVHILLAVIAMVALWYHLDEDATQKALLEIAISFWTAERAIRLVRLLYRNVGGGGNSGAVVEPMPGDALRVTLNLARPWTLRPGQYFFLTVPGVGLWTSHPFSAAWSEDSTLLTDEKGLVMTQQDVLAQPKTTSISAIIRRRDGFTNRLFQKASSGRTKLSVVVEGPYGLSASLSSYGTVLLIAGGVGITHQMPYVRSLIADFTNGTGAARRICLVWVIQSPEYLEWIRPWMTTILGMDQRRDILRVQLFVTRPRSAKEIQSPSSTVQMFPGRPNVDTLVGKEVENQVGAMAVSVCGTAGLADDVRRAVRRRQCVANIDLVEESFSW